MGSGPGPKRRAVDPRVPPACQRPDPTTGVSNAAGSALRESGVIPSHTMQRSKAGQGWIFQSVFTNYDLPGALKEAIERDWALAFLVKQHKQKIARDDTVFVCFGEPEIEAPGLYATATVKEPPDNITPRDWERKYARTPLPPEVFGVWLKIERLLRPPVPRCRIYELPELKRHQFVAAHTGTNFWLDPEQSEALNRLVEGWS